MVVICLGALFGLSPAAERITDSVILQVIRAYSEGETESMWIAFGSDFRVCGFTLKRRDGTFIAGPELYSFPGKRMDPAVNIIVLEDGEKGHTHLTPSEARHDC